MARRGGLQPYPTISGGVTPYAKTIAAKARPNRAFHTRAARISATSPVMVQHENGRPCTANPKQSSIDPAVIAREAAAFRGPRL
jgi:hypothetical protein